MDETVNVFDLHKDLEATKFYGTITEHWQDGKIVLIERRQTFKPGDFKKVVIVLEESKA